jgi:hypothetical protein
LPNRFFHGGQNAIAEVCGAGWVRAGDCQTAARYTPLGMKRAAKLLAVVRRKSIINARCFPVSAVFLPTHREKISLGW